MHEAELNCPTQRYTHPNGLSRASRSRKASLSRSAPLMAISQSDDIWVVANFKKRSELMQPGQRSR